MPQVASGNDGYVFISYRHGADGEYVSRLAEYLETKGVRVWFDREIISGDRWHQVILDRVNGAAAVIVVMTPEAHESSWVNREISQAEETKRPILPLLLSGTRFFRLADLQFEDVTSERMPSQAYVNRLLNHLTPEPKPETSQVDETKPPADKRKRRNLIAVVIAASMTVTITVIIIVTQNGNLKAGGPSSPGASASASVSPSPSLPPWRANTAVQLTKLTQHNDNVNGLAYSPSGDIMVSVGFDRTIKVWSMADKANPKELTSFQAHTGPIFRVAFSPNGTFIATTSNDGTVILWDMHDPGKPSRLKTLTGHRELGQDSNPMGHQQS